MKKLMGLVLLALLGASASSQATVFVGDLKIEKVMCVRAPCPPLVSFTSGALKPFVVRAVKGSNAEAFLKLVTLRGNTTSLSVTIEGQIERENVIVATDIVRTENEAPVHQATLSWTGYLDAERAMCVTSPCPALSTLVNNKGVRYSINSVVGSQAEKFLDNLNTTMGAETARLKVRVVGTYQGKSMIINATKIEVIK